MGQLIVKSGFFVKESDGRNTSAICCWIEELTLDLPFSRIYHYYLGNNRMDNNRPRDGDDGEDRTGGDWRSGGGLPPMRDDGRGGGRDDRGGYGGDRDRGKQSQTFCT